jgi:hypothetical protein
MSYLDDLVKLRYLAPLREAFDTAVGNVNTSKSQDVIKEFIDKLQTNEDGTGRSGGASALDLSKPESIQKLLSMQNGTLSKLIGISGGNMDTPEIKGVQDISDRILKGMGLGSEMASKAGTTAYQQGEIRVREKANELTAKGMPSEIAEREARAYELKTQGDLNKRLPKAGMERQRTATEMEIINGMQEAVLDNKDPIVVEHKGEILDAIRENTTLPYASLLKWSGGNKTKATQVFNAISDKFKTIQDKKSELAIDIQRRSTIAALQKNWDEMDLSSKNTIVTQAKKSSGRKDISDEEAEKMARSQWMIRNMKELGIDPGILIDPLGLKPFIKPRQSKGASGTW